MAEDRNLSDPNDLFSAAEEQDSEVHEAQEGDYVEDVDADSIIEQADAKYDDDSDEADITSEVSDPEVDAFVNDVLDIDTSEEAAAQAAATEDESEVEEVDPYAEFKMELRLKPGKWYVIHTYAGFERKVRDNLNQRAQTMDVEDYIYEVQVPMEDVVEIKNGQRKMVTRVRIPGYVLVRMELNEDTWSVVRHTPGVTGFVGNAHNPTPLRFKEAFDMLKSLVDVPEASAAESKKAEGGAGKAPVAEVDYEIGETITIKEGSFEGLTGSISEINPVSGKLTALVSLFGRETPVELAFDQVSKL
ncbi:transcription termination/antitermination protein NusG [Gulosibacter chungangensis]|uniref:Transcription termination/antitermination protein NusG n=1 Tax=Gulosibacter chungangensis TaxID=979746 RepID=A0A7J5BF66_9MICO|nr:transcription termination/antitermination protein NusG [Gulosibacter chungangensis]KAB1644875.1 transcription termination/antitermination protein NusG [Gulosibacter chungangensis]